MNAYLNYKISVIKFKFKNKFCSSYNGRTMCNNCTNKIIMFNDKILS